MPDVVTIELTAFSDSVISAFHLISPDAAQLNIIGPPGPQGEPGSGSGSIDATTNLIEGDGAGAGVDSGIAAADVCQKQTSFTTPTTLNEVIDCLQAAGLCAAIIVLLGVSSVHAVDFGDVSAATDVSTLWVPPARTVNGHALSSNVTVTPTDLSLVIGTDVQAFDADLTALAALSGTHTIYYRSAANTWSSVTIGSGLDFTGATLSATGGGSVDDTAFASSWNGVTTTAPSKNVVYDWGHLFDTDDDGKVNVLDLGAGIPKTDASGVLSLASAGTDYLDPTYISDTAFGVGWDGDTTHAPSKNAVYDGFVSAAGVDDTAFASSWNGVTGTAPSKNAVYDWGHIFDTDDDGKVNVVDLATAGAVTTDSSGVLSSVAPGTSGNVLTSNGTAWTSAAPAGGGGSGTTVKVAGSNFTNSSTSLVNITGLTFAAATNKVYEVEATLKVQSDQSGGMNFAVTYSAAGATGSFIQMGNTVITSVTPDGDVLGTASGTACASTVNQDTTVKIWSVVTTTSNAGNITIQVKQASGGNGTIYIGSRMTVTEL